MNTNNFIQKDGKTVIPVPAGIRYMSEWTDFNLTFFRGPYIIDKQIPGCGFTESILTNDYHTILCSPRKILLENKADQHLTDIYYAKNEFDQDLGIDKDLTTRVTNKSALSNEIIHESLNSKERMETGIMDYCNRRIKTNQPIKIIVTYDSFKYVKQIFEEKEILQVFTIVVDEFQSVFVDSRFKGNTEFDFLNQLLGLSNNICFVSATPMMDKYLKQIDYFKNLPYYELDWSFLDPGRVMNPELKVRKTKSVFSEIKRIVNEYRNGEFAVLANPVTGSPVQSKEAVFYVNSVSDILKVIKSLGLAPDQVNILCSDTPQNQKKLKSKLGKGYTIGKVPLKSEPHKMFTFCTRTVYLGADFYSTNARTFVLSDANVDSLSVDISLDLPQILGRQRLLENPWKNHAEFYFKTLGKDKEFSKKEFDEFIKKKLMSTERLLNNFYSCTDEETKKDLIKLHKNNIIFSTYSDNYISVNYIDGEYKPVMNNLVYIAEQRAFDIQQVDYKDRFSVFNTIYREHNFQMDRISEFVSTLINTTIPFPERLKLLCETEDFSGDEKKLIAQQASEGFDKYYNLLGPDKCKSWSYHTTSLNKLISDITVSKDKVVEEILTKFVVGNRYSLVEVKSKISEVYTKLGINKSPKATDLEEWFEVKRIKFVDPITKTKVNGFKIISKL